MSFITDNLVFPKEPKSYKEMFLVLFGFIAVGFGFAAFHDYPWQASFIGGSMAWFFLSFLPTVIFNLIYYIGKGISKLTT